MWADILAGAATGSAVALILTQFFVRRDRQDLKLLIKDCLKERDAYIELQNVYKDRIGDHDEAARTFRQTYIGSLLAVPPKENDEQDLDSVEDSRGN